MSMNSCSSRSAAAAQGTLVASCSATTMATLNFTSVDVLAFMPSSTHIAQTPGVQKLADDMPAQQVALRLPADDLHARIQMR